MGTRISRPLGLVGAVLVAAFVVAFVFEPALAAPGLNTNVKIAMHTKAHPTSCTKGYPTFTSCEQILTTWAGQGDLDVMPVFYDLAEITVVELGLTWPAEWGTMSWVRCKGTIAVGGILNPGDGTAISWSTCQYAWSQAPGYGWVIATGPGTVTPIPYFATGDYGVVDCQSPAAYNYPISTSYAGVAGTPGQDPCVSPIVAPTLRMADNIGATSCAFRGSDIVYTLNYKNENADSITGVTLVDTLPPYVVFGSATGTYTFDSGVVTWSIPDMAAGDSGAVTVTVTVDQTAPYGGVLVNNARIGCSETSLTSSASVSTHVCACMIDGPTAVCPLTTTVFCAPEGTGFTYAWSVTGGGATSGPTNGRCANVTTGSVCDTTYTVHLTVTDGQGIVSECQQDVTVNDTEMPNITSYPQDTRVQCMADVPAVNTRDVRGTDNCGTPTASHAGDDTTGTTCDWVINRTYRLTDACGNFDEVVQHITVRDTVPPVITACPADTTVQCVTDVPAANPDLVSATDNCGMVNRTHQSDQITGSACNGSVVRTYRVTDGCANWIECTQTFTVLDTTEPYFTSACPADTTVECDQVPEPAAMTAEDLCDSEVDVTVNDQRTDGACPNAYTIARTWTATDDCGNSATSCTQTITVVDTTAPQIVSGPPDTNLQCLSDLPAPDTDLVVAADNCGTATVTWEADDTTGTACSGNVDRAYRVADQCGNYILAYHHFRILDTTLPVFTSHPSDVAVQCTADIPAPDPRNCSATDNCGTAAITFFSDVSDGNTCPEVITRTYQATDPCDNAGYAVQLITVDDTEAPTLMCQSNKSVPCGGPIEFDLPSASDVCDPSPTLNIVADSSHVNPETGEITHTRCWTATDACGNTSQQCCQEIVEAACGCLVTGVDRTCPGASNQFCGPADMATYAWTIDGDGFIATADDQQCVGVVAGNGCDTYFTVYLEATNASGGVSHCQKRVSVVDATRPAFTAVPGTFNVQCSDSVPDPDPTLLAATDGCSAVTITWVSDISNGGTCPEIITRTYRATDECGNFADTTHYIRVHDTTPPVVTCPGDVTRECTDVRDTGVATATDNCDGALTPTYDDQVVPGNGPGCYTIERTWGATDACNNTGTCLQTITVIDSELPTITCAPDDTIGCADPLVFTEPTASDLCAGAIVPTVVSTDTTAMPNGEIQYTRCWEASDGCGNTAQCCQTITREACPFLPLEVTKTSNVTDCVNPGDVYTYTMSYRNPNASTVTYAYILDPIPATLTVVDAHGGEYRPGPPPSVIWLLGDLPGLATGEVTLDVQVNSDVPYGSEIYNETWIHCDEADHGGDRDTVDVCEFTYLPLRLTKDDNVTGSVSPGDTIKYEIRCYNDNNVPVNNVVIKDVLPDGVTLAWATSPYDYDIATREITWSLGALDGGASLLVNLWVTVDDDAMSGGLINTARVTSDETQTEVTASHTTRVEGGEIAVYFDIKPGSCPNPLNPDAKGVLPAAVLGTADFDVMAIDPASLRVSRGDMTASVAPLRWSYADMATPPTGDACECTDLGPDGYRDLGLKFSLVDLVSTLNLAGAAGRTVELTITGTLLDGTPIRGTDCVRVLGRTGDGDGGASLAQPAELRFEAGDQVGVPNGAQVDLSFYSAVSGQVSMGVYDVHGRLVASLLDSEIAAGSHLVTWNMTAGSGQTVPAGIYFVRVSTSAHSVTKKLVVVE